MELKLYNSFTQNKEVFQPKDKNSVKIYSCGPTVYNYAHIGNLRSFIFVDVLRRSLKLLGYKLDQTMNITDIDDKIIRESIANKVSIEEFTKKWIQAFFEDLISLNIEPVEHYPKATEHIESMIELIQKLDQNGFTYEKDGSIYFSIDKFKNYGRLSKVDFSGTKSGARYDADEYDKDDVRDFVLWKFPKDENEKSWDTKIGKGRPGWHLECSAMIRKIYQSGIDIHTGGIDLLFPHHENEIAQSECAYPNEPFVKYWLHCEHLLVENQKMSKSLGNFYTLRDLLDKGYDLNSIRYLLLSFHYKTKLNFSISRIEESKKAIERIQNTLTRILEFTNGEFVQTIPTGFSKDAYTEFLEGLADDLNIPKSLGTIFEFVKLINTKLDTSNISKEEALDITSYFYSINRLLVVLNFNLKSDTIEAEVESLIQKRQDAKQNKNFALADEIRKQLTGMGIILEDSKTGVKWRRK